MEGFGHDVVPSSRRNRKRKLPEMPESDQNPTFLLQQLNQDLLERVLACLPTSTFLRFTSVCKKWKSVLHSPTFKLACARFPFRDPCFLMVDSRPHSLQGHRRPVIFDSAEKIWRKLNPLPLPRTPGGNPFIPVASSRGLVCFRSENGEFSVVNPVTASSRCLPLMNPVTRHPIHAVSMMSVASSFKVVVICGEFPNLASREYNSGKDRWEEEIKLTQKISYKNKDNPVDSEPNYDDSHYFLTKCGNIVSTDMQRSPYKQFSSVLTVKDDKDEILHFLSSSGAVVSCNLTRRFFSEYPRLMPVFSEYSIDLVECGGRMYAVLLSEFFESASVRVWKWDEEKVSWEQVAAMPPAMSHKFYGKRVDINCSGAGKQILVCFNSAEISGCVMCDLTRNEWVELPEFRGDVKDREFVCAFSFEPRIEVES